MESMTTRRAATIEPSDIPKLWQRGTTLSVPIPPPPKKRFHDFLRTPPDVPNKRPRPKQKDQTPDTLTDHCPVQSFSKTHRKTGRRPPTSARLPDRRGVVRQHDAVRGAAQRSHGQ